jgi:succinate dehydrogenase / fumarate reductase membrane anchor subunit
MSRREQSIRTPLGRVRGLGSARHGVGHFITQRVSAIALVVLVPWFLITLIGAVRGGYEGALAYLSDPLNAVVVILAVSAALYHMRLGMQVVIEDYIAKPGLRISLLVLNTFVCIALFATAAYAVLKIAIS